jgi:hypothetical protein
MIAPGKTIKHLIERFRKEGPKPRKERSEGVDQFWWKRTGTTSSRDDAERVSFALTETEAETTTTTTTKEKEKEERDERGEEPPSLPTIDSIRRSVESLRSFTDSLSVLSDNDDDENEREDETIYDPETRALDAQARAALSQSQAVLQRLRVAGAASRVSSSTKNTTPQIDLLHQWRRDRARQQAKPLPPMQLLSPPAAGATDHPDLDPAPDSSSNHLDLVTGLDDSLEHGHDAQDGEDEGNMVSPPCLQGGLELSGEGAQDYLPPSPSPTSTTANMTASASPSKVKSPPLSKSKPIRMNSQQVMALNSILSNVVSNRLFEAENITNSVAAMFGMHSQRQQAVSQARAQAVQKTVDVIKEKVEVAMKDEEMNTTMAVEETGGDVILRNLRHRLIELEKEYAQLCEEENRLLSA